MSLRTLAVIPAYNEALNIEKTVCDLRKNAPDVDFIVVNDGSRDNTLEVLQRIGIPYIDSLCNLGLFGAVQTGFKYALYHGYDIVVQFDGDGQHNAGYIQNLINEIRDGSDIAIGSRFVSDKKPWTARMAGSRLISTAMHLVTGKRIMDPTSGFRAYNRACIKAYALDANMPPEPDTLVYMLRQGKKITEVQVQMSDREFGESYLNLPNTVKYMSRMMISILLIQPFRKVR
ncbi:glycosyltransferase family 2 protein [Faecalibaculum rodentium]|jgi:glycosyltransferase involved in cell wall biosynthesis|uniref:glycosyltransferase family 2 protein n=1 Tax=Faecalibaculum rodentium TaxID=1702221 RepID=UPI0023F1AE48|nr:glycosyltransferase family 2 protein [Faecalibaculum rodentium]